MITESNTSGGGYEDGRCLFRRLLGHVFLAAGADGGLERSGGEYFEESGGV